MAKRRKDDDQYETTEYPETQTEPSDADFADGEPTEDEAMEESSAPAAPTTGGPQVYRVERSGGTVRGKTLEEGESVILTPEEAQRLAASGAQLSWLQEDQESRPDGEPDNTLPPEEPPPEVPPARRR
jgi:hypothetical protein